MVKVLATLLAEVAPAGFSAPPPAAQASGPASCNTFASRTRLQENVPDGLLRDRTTLINGLPPVCPGAKS